MRMILPLAALLLPAAAFAQSTQPMNPTGPTTAPANTSPGTMAPASGSDTMSPTDSTMTPPTAADPATAPDAAMSPPADSTSNSTMSPTDDAAPMTNKSKAKPKKMKAPH